MARQPAGDGLDHSAGRHPELGVAEEIAGRIKPFGWSMLLQLNGRELPDQEAMIKRLPVRIVIDHVAKFIDPVPVDHPAF